MTHEHGWTWHCKWLGWALMTTLCKTTFYTLLCSHHAYRSCHAMLEMIIHVPRFLYSLHALGMTILFTSCNTTCHKLLYSQFSYVHITFVTSLYWYSLSSEEYWPCNHASSTEADLIHLPARTLSRWLLSVNDIEVRLRRKRVQWTGLSTGIQYVMSSTSGIYMASTSKASSWFSCSATPFLSLPF